MIVSKKIRSLIDRGALFVINHSGGKDSQCSVIELVKIIPENQLLIIHAHLPEVEWAGTWEQIINTVNANYTVLKVIAVKTFFEMVEHRQNWPSPKNRQCTSDLKRGPIEKEIRHYIKDNNLSGLVVNCMGIRADESSARAKKRPLKLNKRNSKAGREWYDWLPIFKYKLSKVWETISDAGQDPHWAYSKGMTRLSCCFCIMASKHDIRISAKHNPELFKRIIETEKRIGHTIFMQKKERISIEDYIGGYKHG